MACAFMIATNDCDCHIWYYWNFDTETITKEIGMNCNTYNYSIKIPYDEWDFLKEIDLNDDNDYEYCSTNKEWSPYLYNNYNKKEFDVVLREFKQNLLKKKQDSQKRKDLQQKLRAAIRNNRK